MIRQFFNNIFNHKKQHAVVVDYSKYTFDSKPDHCPLCHSADIRDYVFGYPTSQHISQGIRQKRLVMGGCVLDDMFVSDNLIRKWHCCACGSELFQPFACDSQE